MKTYDTTYDFVFIDYSYKNEFGCYETGVCNDNCINFLDTRNIPTKKARQCWRQGNFHYTMEPLRKMLENL